MLCPPLSPARLVTHWLDRHRGWPTLVLHLIGVPVSVLGLLLAPAWMALLSWRLFLFSAGLFVGGYLLQFAGHLTDRTIPGELVVLARLVRRPGRGPGPPSVSP